MMSRNVFVEVKDVWTEPRMMRKEAKEFCDRLVAKKTELGGTDLCPRGGFLHVDEWAMCVEYVAEKLDPRFPSSN